MADRIITAREHLATLLKKKGASAFVMDACMPDAAQGLSRTGST